MKRLILKLQKQFVACLLRRAILTLHLIISIHSAVTMTKVHLLQKLYNDFLHLPRFWYARLSIMFILPFHRYRKKQTTLSIDNCYKNVSLLSVSSYMLDVVEIICAYWNWVDFSFSASIPSLFPSVLYAPLFTFTRTCSN